MELKKITNLHKNLISGVSIEDLSDMGLLRYGTLILKQFKAAKAALRKLEPHQDAELAHWCYIRDYTNSEVDRVLCELEQRMSVGLEDFGEKALISFTELCGNIRYAIFAENHLDTTHSKDTDINRDIDLILE